ncbi:MAG: hypothetical protein IPN26_07280 [Bacteroidetes bacterium]|nr:hypothetical protein [Bacteroidota bacterium]
MLCLFIAFAINAQKLNTFTIQLESKKGGNIFVSMQLKKSASETEVKSNVTNFDFVLMETKDGSRTILNWYNLNGKNGYILKSVLGSNTLINTISLDKDQFDKCKSVQDFDRMTGHISPNSFSHFASITDDLSKGVLYHCFIVQQENGKRALMWLEEKEGEYTLEVKVRE